MFRNLKSGPYQCTDQNACFCLFFSNNQNIVLHIVGSVQGCRLQHEVAYEGTIPTICFTRDHLYASTAKGASKKDKENIRSTRRSPSLWDIVDSQEQQTQGSQTKSTGTSRKSARKSNMSHTPPKPIPKNSKSIPVKVHIPYKDQIPLWMHDFIEKVEDVLGDGHYRFQAVAVLRNFTVDDHQMICYHLYKELIGV